ncbi:MAG: hypothetical protein PHN90_10075 [Methanothrix sp.]|nr:hypothetical protein [Methanothrix harundinacea]MDD3565999.1 hypothetical protein [Methanothrix sp.]MDI9398983.1 hypothetical protein [Euryarchaeota archaeon]
MLFVELLGHVEVVLVLAEDQLAVASGAIAPGGETAAPFRAGSSHITELNRCCEGGAPPLAREIT